MRLIDADALIEKCGNWYVEEGTESGFIGTLKNLLAMQPTVQPDLSEYSDRLWKSAYERGKAEALGAQPEIIRYKDCKHYLHDEEYGFDWCNRMSGVFRAKPDGFCSWAVMRGGDSDE